MVFMQTEETFIQCSTLIFQHSNNHFYTSIFHHLYSTTSHFRIGIKTTNYYTTYSLLDN